MVVSPGALVGLLTSLMLPLVSLLMDIFLVIILLLDLIMHSYYYILLLIMIRFITYESLSFCLHFSQVHLIKLCMGSGCELHLDARN